jgi:small-conductance mechanosensitive channel
MDPAASSTARALQSEKRISWLTLVLGGVAGVCVGYFRGVAWGGGIFIGAVLSWLNFRWLRQGMDTLVNAATAQAEQKTVHVPVGTYFKMAFRYGLIGLVVYVIFKYLNVPLLSMILGLGALGAATVAVSVHEILRPSE